MGSFQRISSDAIPTWEDWSVSPLLSFAQDIWRSQAWTLGQFRPFAR